MGTVLIGDVVDRLEAWAPTSWAEGYDNVGLLVGSREREVRGILTSLDVTEAVIAEAVSCDCNLIIAHHPVIFRPFKRLTGSTVAERLVQQAIERGIALYAAHTNVDNSYRGLNMHAGGLMGLRQLRLLAPKAVGLRKLVCFVPLGSVEAVRGALHAAGAGAMGAYDGCSFQVQGKGRFRPLEGATPHIGEANAYEEVEEARIELLFPTQLQSRVIAALCSAHPYETAAYYVQDLENENPEIGSGVIGELEVPLSGTDFLATLRAIFRTKGIRYSGPTDVATRAIRRVAFCGGAGSGFIQDARREKADVFVSSELKYHDYIEHERDIMLCDIGHYESEYKVKDLFLHQIQNNFPTIAACATKVHTNPVQYYG